jgi:hypothetical protein
LKVASRQKRMPCMERSQLRRRSAIGDMQASALAGAN